MRIDGIRFAAPVAANVRPDVPIETGVDLTAIKKSCQILKGMNFLLLQIGRINDTFPIFIGKPGSADVETHLPKL